MKFKLATGCFVLGAVLAPVAFAADSDTDRNKPATFIKDSAITTKIKTKLAAENPASMATIHVDTDKDGVVGSAALPSPNKTSTRQSRSPRTPKA